VEWQGVHAVGIRVFTVSREPVSTTKSFVLSRKMAAFEAIREHSGVVRPGLLLHLSAGTSVEICGDGFSDRTVQIRANHSFYFVLLKSVLEQPACTYDHLFQTSRAVA
jgi:hypothetical protein